MNELIKVEETMSSKQIAELLNIQHDKVKHTIERLSDWVVIRFAPMEVTYV